MRGNSEGIKEGEKAQVKKGGVEDRRKRGGLSTIDCMYENRCRDPQHIPPCRERRGDVRRGNDRRIRVK